MTTRGTGQSVEDWLKEGRETELTRQWQWQKRGTSDTPKSSIRSKWNVPYGSSYLLLLEWDLNASLLYVNVHILLSARIFDELTEDM